MIRFMRAHSLWRFTGVWLAAFVVFAAQFLLDQPDFSNPLLARLPVVVYSQPMVAVAMLVLAALLFALAAPPKPVTRPAPASLGTFQDQPSRLARPLFGLALIGYGAAVLLWLLHGEDGGVLGLWGGALVLLVVSQIPSRSAWRWPMQTARAARAYALPALLLLLAAALRLYRLADLPQDVHGDMASHGMQTLDLLAGRASSVIAYGWAGIPMTGFLPTALMMRLTGDHGTVGLALASVLGGVLSVWGLYVWLHATLGRRTALVGAALLAVAYTHIHFSRIAEYMDPMPFTVWSLAFLAIGLQQQRSLPFVLSGAALAGAGSLYYAGRVTLVIVALALLYLFLVDRRLLEANRRGLLWLAVGAVVTLGPLLWLFILQPDDWLQRSREVWLFHPAVLEHSRHKYGVASLGQILLEQARRTLLLFNKTMDSSTQFGFPRPLLDAITGPLVVLGAGYALAHPRRWASGLLALALFTVLLVGGILTDNPPFAPRLVFVLAPAVGLAALAIERLWQATVDAFGEETNRLLSLLVVAMLLYVGLLNWTLYYQFAVSNARPRALVGRFVATLPADAAVCIVPDDDNGWIHAPEEREIAFFMGERKGYRVPPDENGRLADLPAPCTEKGAVWIVPEPRQSVLPQLQQRFAGGVLTAHGRRAGEIAFFAFRLP